MLKLAKKVFTKEVFELEASTGILLLIASFASLLVANSDYLPIYQNFFNFNLALNLTIIDIYKDLTLHDWINDALMALFFLMVGLELKEEILVGELSKKSQAMLPLIAACGGVIMPAVIFYLVNFQHPQNLPGFAIPTATDIAFAYGIISLFGNKIPKSLKVFLISLAIFDDLIAIIIIALFYSENLAWGFIIIAFLIIIGLAILNLRNSTNLFFYLTLGIILWLMVLKSGIHPTLAGVILAIFIPRQKNLLHKLITKISPWVNFAILPIFAFANSAVRIDNLTIATLSNPLVLGIILGLFLGKPLGVTLFSFLAVKLGSTKLPSLKNEKPDWLLFFGVSVITGIGFTMSFFIGALAFKDQHYFDLVKIGVLSGSLFSAILGMIIIKLTLVPRSIFKKA